MPGSAATGSAARWRRCRPDRRAILALCLLTAGCGWAPLYANPETGPAAADLRAVSVAPIPERLGQNLELALRAGANPGGEPTPARYVLHVTPILTTGNLGITEQGFGTLGREDVTANFVLIEVKTGRRLFAGSSHFNASFNVLANGYSNVVAQNDADRRVVEELSQDILTRLTVFFQHRAATLPHKA